MHTKSASLSIIDDKDFYKHRPFNLTIGEYMQVDKAPVWQKSYWTVTVSSGPLIRSPVTFHYLDQTDAQDLISRIESERSQL